MRPFLRWPGGKRWLICHHADILPKQYDRYIEPFLGSGSVYFHLSPRNAILSDTNAELINTFRGIRDDWHRVLEMLKRHGRQHGLEYYYKVRSSRPTSVAGRAARLIYLNRTCFNGIYRVSREGNFNVPKGSKSSVLLPTDDFEGTAVMLSTASLRVSDFESVIDESGPGDFVFADPPYTVNHNNNGFIKYNEHLFSWSDQRRLAAALARAQQRGATVVSTNADHSSVKRLYWKHGFSLRSVRRSSTMSCSPAGRKRFGEVIIRSVRENS